MNYTDAKKQRVIDLGNQGYARSEMAKLTKLTPKQVGSILRKSYLKSQGYNVTKNVESSNDKARRELLLEGCDPKLVELHFPCEA